MDLEAIAEIERLKYRYVRFLDLKQWDDFGLVLAPHISARYGDRLSFDTRDEVVTFMRDSLGPTMITMHHVHHPEIDVAPDGATATGTWALEDTVIMTEHRLLLTGASFYSDEYRRNDAGDWEIAATSYVRTFEAMQSLDDTPTFKLTANRWA